jgi:hypothetical protein
MLTVLSIHVTENEIRRVGQAGVIAGRDHVRAKARTRSGPTIRDPAGFMRRLGCISCPVASAGLRGVLTPAASRCPPPGAGVLAMRPRSAFTSPEAYARAARSGSPGPRMSGCEGRLGTTRSLLGRSWGSEIGRTGTTGLDRPVVTRGLVANDASIRRTALFAREPRFRHCANPAWCLILAAGQQIDREGGRHGCFGHYRCKSRDRP